MYYVYVCMYDLHLIGAYPNVTKSSTALLSQCLKTVFLVSN